ncbi:MAG TPA: alpha/beta hydrolase fold domain-containing protein [Puia sp.]|nr:alpha/beta hydrolase fold domain-containing protein [Puia sp.]
MNVYKHYSQEQLNHQYNTRLQVPDYADYFDRWERQSRQTAEQNTLLKDISFGAHPEELLDIFPSKIPGSKTLIFIHGGYWHLLDKTMFHFLAEHFLKYNITTVLINYPLAPQASIHEIVRSCRRALGWIHDNIIHFSGDPTELYLMGHSAGGHLAAMLLTEEEGKFARAVISLSGIFRLEPVMLSYLNDAIHMDSENAIKNSPVFLNPASNCSLLLVVGSDESGEFKDQSEELYKCWKSKCSNTELLMVPQKNHYSILDAVVEKDSVLKTAIIHMMNVDPEVIRIPL